MRSRLFAATIVVALHAFVTGGALAESGALQQLDGTDGCISNDGTGGECTPGIGLDGALDVAITADGASVYVGSFSGGAVAALARNKSRIAGPIGRLTQAASADGCVSETGTGGACSDGKALKSAGAVVVSNDGKSVYVASLGSGAVAVFARQSR